MRNLLFPAASALALMCAAGPLVVTSGAAQTAMTTTTTLTASQQVDYDSWTPEQRAAYDGWPTDAQAYYWTLTLNQMHGWWKLSDAQRLQVLALTPEQRVAAWTSIEAQLAGQPVNPAVVQANPVGSTEMPTATPPNPDMAAAPVPPAMPADPSYQAGPYKGALTPAPAEAMNKVYPLCTRKIQDSCRNPGGK